MLIIAIGKTNSEFTSSCEAKREEVDPEDLDSVLQCVSDKLMYSKSEIEEVLIIEYDEIISRFDYTDGLGDRESEEELEYFEY